MTGRIACLILGTIAGLVAGLFLSRRLVFGRIDEQARDKYQP